MRSFKVSSAILWAVIIILPIGLSGCADSSQPAAGTSSKNVESVKSTAEKLGQPPSEEECLEFARRVEKAVLEGDRAAFDAAIDYDAILESATGGIPGMEDLREGFIAGAKIRLQSDNGFAAEICKQVELGGSFVFLNTVDVESQKRIRFRLLLPDDGMNYHEWIVVRDPSGQVKAVDIYVLLSAELVSKTMRRSFLPIVANENRSALSKLVGGENEFVRHFPKLESMLDAFSSGDYDKAESIYLGMPTSMKHNKAVLLMRLQAATASGDDTRYIAAIDDFRKFHPQDPCVDIISIDYHVLNQNYDKGIECIKNVNKAIGGDPYLIFLQGNIYFQKGDLKAARRLLQDSIKAEPTLEQPYWSLVEISLKEKNFDETNRLFAKLEENFQIEISDLETIPEYAEYLKSPQYQKLFKTQQAKKAPKQQQKEQAKKQTNHQPIQLPGLDGKIPAEQ